MLALIIAWYALTALSLVYLVWDLTTNTPTGTVMKLAWFLVVAYTGPVGLAVYWFSCRKPKGVSHDDFIKDHWKQATGSLLHCVAGDATGIILSAAVVFHFGLSNGLDLIIEYLTAFVFGLLIFQALFMIKMYNGNYWLAVRKTFFAETVSMNCVMLGMFPAMLLLKKVFPDSDSPYQIEFWFVMSLATIAGMITAYPINSWMVKRGLKHGMMSAKPKSADAHAGHSAMPMQPPPAGHDSHQDMPMAHDHGSHEHGHEGHDMSKMGHDMPGMTEHSGHGSHEHAMPMEHSEPEMKHEYHGDMSDMKMDSGAGEHAHHSASLPLPHMLGVIVGTFALLFLAIWLTSLAVPIRF